MGLGIYMTPLDPLAPPSLKIQHRLLLLVVVIFLVVFTASIFAFWFVNSLILLAAASYYLASLSCFTLSVLSIRKHISEIENSAIGLISSSSDKREWSDAVNCDKGIALAMAEEQNTTDGRSQLSELDEIKPIAESPSWRFYLCIQLCLVGIALLIFILAEAWICLVGIALLIFILAEAWNRFLVPEHIEGNLLCFIGVGTIILIGTMGIKIRSEQQTRYFTCIRTAYLHVFNCVCIALLSFLAGAVIWYSPLFLVSDTIIAIILVPFIAYDTWISTRTAWQQLKQNRNRTPTLADITQCLTNLLGVKEIIDIYLWDTNAAAMILQVHVQPHAGKDVELLKQEIHSVLHDTFHIEHITILTATPHRAPTSPGLAL